MRKIGILLALAALLFSCQGGDKKSGPSVGKSDDAKTSYAFGALVASDLKTTGVKIDADAFLKGLQDVLERNVKVDMAEANNTVQGAIRDAQTKLAQVNLDSGTKFLEENSKKNGVKTTSSGLQYEVITDGTGPKPKASDIVKVDYVGTLIDGTTFDSSIERHQPAVFPLGNVIPGWTEGLQLMPVGSKYKFYIPAKLAYGEQGPQKIGPNQALIFEVSLLSIEPPAPGKK